MDKKDPCGFNSPKNRRINWNINLNLKKPKIELKRKTYSEPIWNAVPNKVEPDPLPPPTEENISTETRLVNKYGSTKGEEPLILDENNEVGQRLYLDEGNLHEVYTQVGFTMNNNEKSELTLTEDTQRFDEGFDRLNANKHSGSEDTVSKEEFMAFMAEYARDAQESIDRGGNEQRREEAVYFNKNKEELEKIFVAMAGVDERLTKQEFEDFWNELMSKGIKTEDKDSGKVFTTITGADLNELVNDRLKENGMLPTFRKSNEEIEQIIQENKLKRKEQELQDIKVNVNSEFVEKIEYSADKEISFVTLNDGTQLQINNKNTSNNGIKITKENDRYVITNNEDRSQKSSERCILIIPGENSKITMRDCKGVTYSSPNNKNDDVIIEGRSNNNKVNLGSGEDHYVNNKTSGYNPQIIKAKKNKSVKLENKYDINVKNVKKSKKFTTYESRKYLNIEFE